jgi:threonine aldolase
MAIVKRGFGSDNFSGVLPEVFDALKAAAVGHEHSYGEDPYTEKAIAAFRNILGDDVDVFFVYNGTGANVLGISTFVRSFQAVICPETAHINVDECGALTRQTGSTLITVPTPDGKLTVELIEQCMHGIGNQHNVQPRAVSISECTELGTVYTPEELKAITSYAHANGLVVHVDGARIANAIAYLGCKPKELLVDTGIDVLSFGGTKNGMMFGEAVVFFNRSLAEQVKYIRKQEMQLHSKGRFIAAQFLAVLSDGLWLRSASHANAMARLLAEKAASLGIEVTQKVEGDQVFVVLPSDKAEILQQSYFFYPWNEKTSEYRWVCSFDTTEDDIRDFVLLLEDALKK